jgi:hypothetical protein
LRQIAGFPRQRSSGFILEMRLAASGKATLRMPKA